ncbi:MAG TPA: hypothetical protein ACHBZ9_05765 [Arsenophonus nasoniae]|uniref:hypothetical protein n=1 Tax=Arsenophonus nasoniae TaxID=638 RepID=UPI00387A5604
MAKNKKRSSEILATQVGLPPELQVDMPTDNGEPPIYANDTPAQDEPPIDAQPDAEPVSTQPEKSEVVVVVLKGHTLEHNGQCYREDQSLTLNNDDADRLSPLGVVGESDCARSEGLKINTASPVNITQGE